MRKVIEISWVLAIVCVSLFAVYQLLAVADVGEPSFPFDVDYDNVRARMEDDGIRVAIGDYAQTQPSIATDGDGGLLVVWRDYRYDQNDIFAQRLDESGQSLWDQQGTAVCVNLGNKEYAECISDGSGGLITAWHDWRDYNYDIFAQRIERYGYWGYPSATISSVQDISGDQGGSVRLSWAASRLFMNSGPGVR